MPKRYYITTPIYYVNSVPHIGTALTTFAADVTARYQKMLGREVMFLTGTDENGLKVLEAAKAAGKDPMQFVDEVAGQFVEIWRGMKIEFDDFIRTTEERHVRCAQEVFQRLREAGHVYPGTYEGWYDVSSETFYKESDLVDGLSPDGNPVTWVQEENFFFRLSDFEERLLQHIESNPQFIVPEVRRNEVVGFLKQGLRDVCITRSNPGWGIPIPGDDSKVIYVWFDALINYITATGWPDSGWEDLWPAEVEWMGKDILTRFHATLWPAMLMGLGLPLPATLVGHGWMTLGGEKISKSKGNVVRPLELAEGLSELTGCERDLAIDAVRHHMAATMPYEDDTVFTLEEFHRRYNTDLANDLGNALNRSMAMAAKFVGGAIPDEQPEDEVAQAIAQSVEQYRRHMEAFRLDRASAASLEVIRFLNKYIDTRAPWALAKSGDPALPRVLFGMALCLRTAEGLLRPFMPGVADAIAAQLGQVPLTSLEGVGTPSTLRPGSKLGEARPMFPRIQAERAAAPEPKAQPPERPHPAKEAPPSEPIGIEDFAKVELRIGRVLEAEPLEGSDKLLRLQVVVGSETRQIVAGIRAQYAPLDLIGRQVVVVANLKPAMLRGAESRGMLLAAVDGEGGAILLQPDREAPEGAKVR